MSKIPVFNIGIHHPDRAPVNDLGREQGKIRAVAEKSERTFQANQDDDREE